MLLAISIISVTVVGLLVSVVLYVHRAESTSALLNQSLATLQLEQERRRATDKAEAEAAAIRRDTYAKKAAEVTTAAGAADLLREAGNRTAD